MNKFNIVAVGFISAQAITAVRPITIKIQKFIVDLKSTSTHHQFTSAKKDNL
jgi:hypothetical protein